MAKNYFICNNCGNHEEWNEANKQETAGSGKHRYICNECARVKSYHTKNDVMVKIPKKHQIGIGFELECVPYSEQDYHSMISATYQMIPTYDGSLPDGGVEFKTPVYQNFSGLKQMFRSLEKYADFEHRQCGQHINISHQEYTDASGMELLREYAEEIFSPLQEELGFETENTLRIWGRDFTGYARDDHYFEHGSWLNLDHNNRLEFRLAKFTDATQYLHLAFLCRELLECVCTNFLQYKDELTYSELKHKASVTAKKLVRLFNKYVNGKANCQRAERNSK